MQLKPSLITMGTINAIIMRRQSAHKTSLLTATRKAVAISLKATRRPCQRTQQERRESVVRALWVSHWCSSHDNNYCHRSINCRNASGDKRKKETLAGNLRQIGQIHAPDLPRQMWDQQQNIQKKNSQAKQKNVAIVTQTPRITRHNRYTSHDLNCLAEPLTPSLVTTEQAQATITKTTILLVLNPKIKRMLVVWCSGLATATSSQVQSAKNISDGFSLRGCLDSKLDARILLRRLVMSSSKNSVWFG